MKFSQLPIGTLFRYQEHSYCKISPLAASRDDGGQRMIPRSATVSPAEDEQAAAGRTADLDPLQTALARHHSHCRGLLEQAGARLPEIMRLELLKELEDSYRQLLGELD